MCYNSIFKIKSSGSTPYSVMVSVEGKDVRIGCNCKAGAMNQLCKHVVSLLENNQKLLYDASQSEEFNVCHTHLIESGIVETYKSMDSRVKSIEKEAKKAKDQFTKEKAEIKSMFFNSIS